VSAKVLRDPLTAWNQLKERGGIELETRDEGLDKRLHDGLNPTAPSLEAALASATMEEFCRAFFEAIHPYVAMFRDILEFFERARAHEGQDQWMLKVDNVPLDLEHFRQFVDIWSRVAKATVQIPAIDDPGFWRLSDALRKSGTAFHAVGDARTGVHKGMPSDVQLWLKDYERGVYRPLPKSLLAPKLPAALRKIALVVASVLRPILDRGLTRNGWMKLYEQHTEPPDRADAYNFWTVLHNETDFALRTFVVKLSTAQAALSPNEIAILVTELDSIMDQYPTRPLDASVSLKDLESVLSLPIWKKRYELYSVWVATEMIRALHGHDIQIHHDSGRIEFAFRETLVATIRSAPGPFQQFSEKRSPLAKPRGAGRTANVQPDHSLWTSVGGNDSCRLTVEVKHYKNSAKTKFVDIFEDYARALPESEIFLVNHGPVGRALDDVSLDVRRRCHALGFLTSSNTTVRSILSNAVRKCVGEPIAEWPGHSMIGGGTSALAIDVSGSMKDVLRTAEMESFIRRVAADARPSQLVAVDERVVRSCSVDESGFRELLGVTGEGTELEGPIRQLLDKFESVVVVTDSGGLETLRGIAATLHALHALAPSGVVVRVCQRRPLVPH
jgi:hypothetical protein